MFFGLTVLMMNWSFKEYIFFKKMPEPLGVERLINTAIVLNQILGKDATIGVFAAGTIPFFVDRNAYDFLGKCDKTVACFKPDLSGAVSWGGMRSVPGHNKYDLNYSLKKMKPTYIEESYLGAGKWGRDDVFEFVRHNYLLFITDSGLHLLLKEHSPDVLWDRIPSLGELYSLRSANGQ